MVTTHFLPAPAQCAMNLLAALVDLGRTNTFGLAAMSLLADEHSHAVFGRLVQEVERISPRAVWKRERRDYDGEQNGQR